MFKGNAAATTLSGTLTNVGASFTVASGGGSGYPTGASGNFYVVIDRGLSKEEKILCSSRATDTFTVAGSGRGVDDTSAVQHEANAIVEHCITGVDADEANNAVANTIGKVTTSQDLLVASGANAFGRLGIGAANTVLRESAGSLGYGKVVEANVTAGTLTDASIAAANKDGAAGMPSLRTLSTTATTACAGNDARLSDQRTPSDNSVTSAKIVDGAIVDADVNAAAAIAKTKLAALAVGQSDFAAGYRATFSGAAAPGSPSQGDVWFDTTNKLLNIYNGTVWITLTPQSATIATSQARASTAYGDPATAGPAVTLLTGTAVIVTLSAEAQGTTNTQDNAFMAVAVSGASTIAAADSNGRVTTICILGGNDYQVVHRRFKITGLTAGSNTFTAKYRSLLATSVTWSNRDITVEAVPT